MTRLHKIAFAAVVAGFGFQFATDASACNRRSSYSHSSYNYSAPRATYHAPSYRPVYQAPVHHEPVYVSQQPTVISQPVEQTIISQPAPPQPAIRQMIVDNNGPSNDMLRALGSFAPESSTPATPPQQTVQQHVGTFVAELGNGAKVQLQLAANGQFAWSATNAKGAQSQFVGGYSITTESLSLQRTGDSQQLAGRLMNVTANGFQFQLGNDSAVLNFVRS